MLSKRSDREPVVLPSGFYNRDVLVVAPELLGKKLWIKHQGTEARGYIITETEAYRGEDDLASHASKGFTKRTAVMYGPPGVVYVYLIYGLYWMLNVVTAGEGVPQAVLIRGLENCNGPGRVGKLLQLDKSFYGEQLTGNQRIWITETFVTPDFITSPRVGIDYAGEPWVTKPWRYKIAVKQ